jgi:hypothetical protein
MVHREMAQREMAFFSCGGVKLRKALLCHAGHVVVEVQQVLAPLCP